MANEFSYEAECESCNGTGLYTGIAERDGIAVVCNGCKGTGKYQETIKYKTFTKRKVNKNIKQVLQVNPGICAGVNEAKGLKITDFGGQPYKDWAKGKPFPPKSEMRKYTCPAWWYQSADYKRKPRWDECPGVGAFSDCKSFKEKHKCWERFDKEKK